MEQVGAQDAQFLFMEEADIVANITAAYIIDQSKAPGGPLRFRKILAHIEERLKNAPIYRRKLMRVPMDLDLPYWVDDPYFQIENHVFHARLPRPADWEEFCTTFARYHSRPLDMGRPLWEIFILEGLDKLEGAPKGSFALITKIHHLVADGTSGIQILGALTDIAPDGPPLHRFPRRRRSLAAPDLPRMLRRAALHNAAAPWRMTGAVMRSSPQIARLVANRGRARLAHDEAAGAPDTIFNANISARRIFDAAEFDLADFKRIRSVFKEAKINDLVLAVCAGGLRKYLLSRGELPKDTLIAAAPVNARAAHPKVRAKDGDTSSFGNDITAMTVPLFTTIEHPVERLKAIVLTTRRTKAAKDGLGPRLMIDLTRQMPAAFMAVGSRWVIETISARRPVNNVIISNVPGPQAPLYFCGAELRSMFGMAPLGGGIGLFIATPSYNGKIAFCITSTREIIPDAPYFMDCLRASFAELLTAAHRRLATAAPPPTIAAPDAAAEQPAKKKSTRTKTKTAASRTRSAPAKKKTAKKTATKTATRKAAKSKSTKAAAAKTATTKSVAPKEKTTKRASSKQKKEADPSSANGIQGANGALPHHDPS